MALTIRNITDDQKQLAKDLTGKGTVSAAVVACVSLAGDYKHRSELQASEIERLRTELRSAQQVIGEARSSASKLLDYVAQGDLLM